MKEVQKEIPSLVNKAMPKVPKTTGVALPL